MHFLGLIIDYGLKKIYIIAALISVLVLNKRREASLKPNNLFMDFPGLWQHFSVPAKELTESSFEDSSGVEAYMKSTKFADTAYFGPEAEFFIFDMRFSPMYSPSPKAKRNADITRKFL